MRRRAAGFTLIELLVAVAVFAVIATIAYRGLEDVIHLRESNDARMTRLRQIQLAMDILCRDFSQLAPRPVRDGLGSLQPALAAGPENVPPIVFTRGGWLNPLGSVRSNQQRVAYSLEDGKLMRSWWPELDGYMQSQPQKQALLSDVDSIKVQYYVNGGYSDIWPLPISAPSVGTHAQAAAAAKQGLLPSGVSITVTLKDYGDITRIVEVATP